MTMDRHESESKLKHYHERYGDLVYTSEVAALREHARDFRLESKKFPEDECEQSLELLIKAVQYESIAQCREALGPNWISPLAVQDEVYESDNVCSLTKARNKRIEKDGVVLTDADRAEILAQAQAAISQLDEDAEPEFFSMRELTTEVVQPRFKIGDPCWVADYDENTGEPIGYLPAVVTGLEWLPDEVYYMIGFHDEEDEMINTNFETVGDDEIFVEMPVDKVPSKEKPKKSRDHLRVVK